MPVVRAIDLGNPEMYDTRWLLERCAESGIVMFSPLAAESGETWEPYLRRIARLTRETRARLYSGRSSSPIPRGITPDAANLARTDLLRNR